MNASVSLAITLVYLLVALVIGIRARGGRSMARLEEWAWPDAA